MEIAYIKIGKVAWRPERITLIFNNQTFGELTKVEGSDSLSLGYYTNVDIDEEILHQEEIRLFDSKKNMGVIIERSEDMASGYQHQLSLTIFKPDNTTTGLIFGSHKGIVYLINNNDFRNPKPIACISDEETAPAIEQQLLKSVNFSSFNDEELATNIISQFVNEQVSLFKKHSSPKTVAPVYEEIRDNNGRFIRIYLIDKSQFMTVLDDIDSNKSKYSQIHFSDLYMRYVRSIDEQATEDISILKGSNPEDTIKFTILCELNSELKRIHAIAKKGEKTKSITIYCDPEGKIFQGDNVTTATQLMDIDYEKAPKTLVAKLIEEKIIDCLPFSAFKQEANLAESILTQFLEKNCARLLGIEPDTEKKHTKKEPK